MRLKWLVAGTFLLAAGYLSLVPLGAAAPYGPLALPLPTIGLAASLITPPTTAALMTSVESGLIGIGAGVLNAARQTGAALGVALSGALIATHSPIGGGMRKNFLIAGFISVAACGIWWRAVMQADAVEGRNIRGHI